MSLNKAVITGKVVGVQETRFTNSDDAVARLVIETGNAAKIKLACWKGFAEKANTLKVGDLIIAEGTLTTHSYKTQSGAARKDLELSVKGLYKIQGELESLNPYSPSGFTKASPPSKPSPNKGHSKEEDLSDVFDEVPF